MNQHDETRKILDLIRENRNIKWIYTFFKKV